MPSNKLSSGTGGAKIKIRALPRRQSLVASVIEQLGNQVRSGAVVPGARLPAESELCRLFAVSRTVVREAVAQLRADELVETRPGQGLYVKNPGLGQRILRLRSPKGEASALQIEFELLEFRAGLETDSARLSAMRRTPADIKALKRAFARLTAVLGADGSGTDEDLGFHLEIARASHNTYIIQVLEFLSDPISVAISRSRELTATRSEFLANAHSEHTAIFNAIIAGDADAAVRAMRSHLEAGQKRLLFCST